MPFPVAPPTRLRVALAFAAVYLIWGSTYFFIRVALEGFPPFLLGAFRFALAATLLLGWCAWRGERIRPGRDLWREAVTGFLLLFIGNGVVIWTEQWMPSAVVAIFIASGPLWFVLLDRPNWGVNLRSIPTMAGVITGFAGVLLLFGDRLGTGIGAGPAGRESVGFLLLVLGCATWAWGSIHAKRTPTTLSPAVGTGWQMAVGGICFLVVGTLRGEWRLFHPGQVPAHAWFGLVYLALFGSVVGYSAYIWLLGVRPATQVSSYAYVNPVVAVCLGAYLGGEPIGAQDLMGLGVILGGVVLINVAKYRSRSVNN